MKKQEYLEKQEKKKFEAKKRQEFTNNLNPMDRLLNLDRRLGKNIGAKKERAKLKLLISKEVSSEKVIVKQNRKNKKEIE